ncbi:MAG: hypothetical protein Q7J54_02745 [Candidatus Woesearchaeota archaeon]|nr:hypothetical protein [Candidatus Woesearchaeota archaeon]
MKKPILFGLFIVGILIIGGCAQQAKQQPVICNSPYIEMGTSCCLDQNNNGICDKDENSIKKQDEVQSTILAREGSLNSGCCGPEILDVKTKPFRSSTTGSIIVVARNNAQNSMSGFEIRVQCPSPFYVLMTSGDIYGPGETKEKTIAITGMMMNDVNAICDVTVQDTESFSQDTRKFTISMMGSG